MRPSHHSHGSRYSSRLLTNSTHCLQEKHDGRRLMVRKQGATITGINRRGLTISIPDAIREAVEHIRRQACQPPNHRAAPAISFVALTIHQSAELLPPLYRK